MNAMTRRMTKAVLVVVMAAGLCPVADAEPRTHYDVDKAPWPCWRGPYGSGSAPSTGLELVDDLNKARPAWKSGDVIPPSSPPGGRQKSSIRTAFWSGGYTTPIVAEGRVFLVTWRPAGRKDWFYTEEDLKLSPRDNRNPAGKRSFGSDDLVLCLDAGTGKTLWKRVAGHGLLAKGYKQGVHQGICYYDGKVYAMGTSGLLYALDAATGEPVWEGRTSVFGLVEKRRKSGHSNPGGNRPVIDGSPAAIDGVVAISQGTVTAFDAKTGKQIWADADKKSLRTGSRTMLNFWQHQGRGYFYAAGRLWEAKTGRLCWEIQGAWDGVFSGDFLVAPLKTDEAKDGLVMACYRITPEAYELVWEVPGMGRLPPPTIHDGCVYAMFGEGAAGAKYNRGPTLCIDLLSGEVLAATETSVRAHVYTWGYVPMAADGRVFPNMNRPAMLNADPKDLRYFNGTGHGGENPAEFPPSEATGAAYAGGFLYVRGETKEDGGRIYCYDLRAKTE